MSLEPTALLVFISGMGKIQHNKLEYTKLNGAEIHNMNGTLETPTMTTTTAMENQTQAVE